MTQLVVTADAEADLSEILDYLKEQASALVAEDYGRRFRVSIERLVEFPGIGSRRKAPRARHPNWRRAAVHPDLRLYGRRRQAHSASHRAQQTQHHAPIGPRRLDRNRCSISSREAVSRRSSTASSRLSRAASMLSPWLAMSNSGQSATKPSSSGSMIAVNCRITGAVLGLRMAYCNSTIHRPEATELATVHLFLQEPIAHRPAADALGGGEDGVHVEAVVAVELGDASPTGRSARRPARARGGRTRRRATTAPRGRRPSP